MHLQKLRPASKDGRRFTSQELMQAGSHRGSLFSTSPVLDPAPDTVTRFDPQATMLGYSIQEEVNVLGLPGSDSEKALWWRTGRVVVLLLKRGLERCFLVAFVFSWYCVSSLEKTKKAKESRLSVCSRAHRKSPVSLHGMLMGCSLWVCFTSALFLHTSTMLLVSANFHQHDSSYPSLWLPGPRLLRLRKTAYGNVQSRDRRLSYFAHALSMGDAAKTPSFGRPLE